MACVHSKPRMNMEDDRLSTLPDDLIHKILSFNSTKHAVQTSALSSRWRFLWTSIPYLNISTDDFGTRLHKLSEFVNRLLFVRNSEVELYSVNICFHREFNEALLKRILDYAFSKNVQQLTVTCLLNDKFDFPLNLLRSPSLKYLRLSGTEVSFFFPYSIVLASTWELPALTTLHLDYVAFHEDNLFSKCANLKNLTLTHFTILRPNNYTLSHPQLSSLTIKDENWNVDALNVVAPRLKNLSIITSHFSRRFSFSIAAPNLVSLLFCGSRPLQFSTDLCYLEKADLCISSKDTWSGRDIATLLHWLHHARFLTLNLEFIEPLITYIERISLQPSPFYNLKGLKMYPVDVPLDDKAHKKVILTPKVINYFLDGSPSAAFTLISYEEIKEKRQKARAIANAAEAQNLMARLHVMLEKERANIETNMSRMTKVESQEEDSTDEEENDTNDQGKAPVERMQLNFKRKLKQMKRFSEDVGVRIDQGKRDTSYIIYRLREIEVLLLKDLPASKRDELQACYSNLRAEVDIVLKEILHHMMIPHTHLSDCFNDLAIASSSSS